MLTETDKERPDDTFAEIKADTLDERIAEDTITPVDTLLEVDADKLVKILGLVVGKTKIDELTEEDQANCLAPTN